jgi:hypothetical protein
MWHIAGRLVVGRQRTVRLFSSLAATDRTRRHGQGDRVLFRRSEPERPGPVLRAGRGARTASARRRAGRRRTSTACRRTQRAPGSVTEYPVTCAGSGSASLNRRVQARWPAAARLRTQPYLVCPAAGPAGSPAAGSPVLRPRGVPVPARPDRRIRRPGAYRHARWRGPGRTGNTAATLRCSRGAL